MFSVWRQIQQCQDNSHLTFFFTTSVDANIQNKVK